MAIVPSAKVATPRAGTGAGVGAAGHAGSRRGAAGRTGSRGHAERAADPARQGNAPDADAGDAVPANFASGLPAEMLSKLREIVRAAEDVGRRFPEEARRIHYDEAPARPIRGQASREETEELREEGIDVSPLPPFLTGESTDAAPGPRGVPRRAPQGQPGRAAPRTAGRPPDLEDGPGFRL